MPRLRAPNEVQTCDSRFIVPESDLVHVARGFVVVARVETAYTAHLIVVVRIFACILGRFSGCIFGDVF